MLIEISDTWKLLTGNIFIWLVTFRIYQQDWPVGFLREALGITKAKCSLRFEIGNLIQALYWGSHWSFCWWNCIQSYYCNIRSATIINRSTFKINSYTRNLLSCFPRKRYIPILLHNYPNYWPHACPQWLTTRPDIGVISVTSHNKLKCIDKLAVSIICTVGIHDWLWIDFYQGIICLSSLLLMHRLWL